MADYRKRLEQSVVFASEGRAYVYADSDLFPSIWSLVRDGPFDENCYRFDAADVRRVIDNLVKDNYEKNAQLSSR